MASSSPSATYSKALIMSNGSAYRPMVFTFAEAVDDQHYFCEILAKRMGVDVMVALDAARRDPGLLRPVSVLPPQKAMAKAREKCVANKDCPVCGDAVCAKACQKFSCGHLMHLECSSAMVASYIDQKKPLPFACPSACSGGGGCDGVMIDPQDEAVFDALNKSSNLCAAYVECTNCDLYIRSFKVEPVAQVVKCSCGTAFCIRCKGRPHVAGLSCMQSMEFEKALTEFGKLADKEKKDEVRKWMSIRYSEAFGPFIPMKWLFIEDAIETDGLAAEKTLKWDFEEDYESAVELATASYQELLVEAKALVDFSDTVSFVAESIPHPFAFATGTGEEAGEATRSKFCPKCFVSIGHDGGCPSMQCPIISCQHRFCYNCLGPEHTHTECKKSINYTYLKVAAAGAGAGAGGGEAIDNLYKFTPEAELAEKAAAFRKTTLESRDVIGMRNTRIARLAPMLQLAAMLSRAGVAGDAALLAQFEKAVRAEQELQSKALRSKSIEEHKDLLLNKCKIVAARIPQSDVDGIVEAGRYQWFNKMRMDIGVGALSGNYELFQAINRIDVDYTPEFFNRPLWAAIFSARPLQKGDKAFQVWAPNGAPVNVNWWGEQSAAVSSYLAGVRLGEVYLAGVRLGEGNYGDLETVPKASLYPATVPDELIDWDLRAEADGVLAALKAALRMRLDQTRSRMIEMFYKGIPFIPPPPRMLQEDELIEKTVGDEDGHSPARKIVGVITGGGGDGAMPYAWFPGREGVRSRVVGAHIVFPECTSLIYQQPIMNEKAALCYDAIVATLTNRSDIEVHPLVRAITFAKEELAGLKVRSGNAKAKGSKGAVSRLRSQYRDAVEKENWVLAASLDDDIRKQIVIDRDSGVSAEENIVPLMQCTVCTYINEKTLWNDKCELCEGQTQMIAPAAAAVADADAGVAVDGDVKAAWEKVVSAMKAVLKEVA